MTRGISFWDRRRAAVRAEEEAEAVAERAAIEEQHQLALAEKSDEEILAELGLPVPETLMQGDDFASFMAKAVPEHIRKRALRKLWRSNPVLACVDGLNDYDDDYLSGSFGNEQVATSYQVGKGLMAHVLEMARQEESSDDTQTSLDNDADLAKDACEPPLSARGEDPACEEEFGAEQVPAPQEPDSGKPRRMVFHFDGNNA